jgi:hypothetical protein
MSITSSIRALPLPHLDSEFTHAESENAIHLRVSHRHLLQPCTDLFAFGDGLHKAFDEHNRHGWCSPDYYPYVVTLRRWLDQQGVASVRTEWEYFPHNDLPAGKLDGLMLGGAARCGVLEIKATLGNGEQARPAHLCQLGGYLALQSAWRGSAPQARWGLLAYALPHHGVWKLHRFQDVARLVRSATKLLAA